MPDVPGVVRAVPPGGPGGPAGGGAVIDLEGGALRSGEAAGVLMDRHMAAYSFLDKLHTSNLPEGTVPEGTMIRDEYGAEIEIPTDVFKGGDQAVLDYIEQLYEDGKIGEYIEIESTEVELPEDWEYEEAS